MRRAWALAAALVLGAPSATAQTFADDAYRGPRRAVGSPENFAVELRIGLWEPDVGSDAFDTLFEDDNGPYVGGEIDYLPLRVPYVGRVGLGLQVGWNRFEGNSLEQGTGEPTDEDASLTLFPLAAVAVVRIDVLARELGIPLVLTGKAGLDGIVWKSDVGTRTEARNVSWGFHWGAQAALELDFFDARAARRLDDEWGINHTYVFFEAFGTTADTSLRLTTDFAWVAGLGLVF